MRRLFQWIGAITVLSFCVGVLSAFQSAARGSYKFRVRQITTSSSTPTYVNDPLVLRDLGIGSYRQICWKRVDSAVGEFTYISDFPTVDDALGWPVVGTEKECQDFDQGIKLYVWHTDLEAPKTIKFAFIE